MSAKIPPGFAEIWIQFNLAADPEPMFCALGVDLAPGTVPNQAEADAMLSSVSLNVRPIVSSDATVLPGHVIYGNDGGDIRVNGTGNATAGTGAAAALPNNCAVLLHKRTAAGGRRGRGRMYVPSPAESSVGSTGNLVAAFVTTCNAAAAAMRSDLIGLPTIDDVVLLHDSAPFTPTVITALEPAARIATQRRRLRP